jgi:hypothetical protein
VIVFVPRPRTATSRAPKGFLHQPVKAALIRAPLILSDQMAAADRRARTQNRRRLLRLIVIRLQEQGLPSLARYLRH